MPLQCQVAFFICCSFNFVAVYIWFLYALVSAFYHGVCYFWYILSWCLVFFIHFMVVFGIFDKSYCGVLYFWFYLDVLYFIYLIAVWVFLTIPVLIIAHYSSKLCLNNDDWIKIHVIQGMVFHPCWWPWGYFIDFILSSCYQSTYLAVGDSVCVQLRWF